MRVQVHTGPGNSCRYAAGIPGCTAPPESMTYVLRMKEGHSRSKDPMVCTEVVSLISKAFISFVPDLSRNLKLPCDTLTERATVGSKITVFHREQDKRSRELLLQGSMPVAAEDPPLTSKCAAAQVKMVRFFNYLEGTHRFGAVMRSGEYRP